MTSYEYKIYELHYYVEYTNFYSEDESTHVDTGDERVRYFSSMDDLMDKLDELKKRYDGHVEPHRYGTTSKRLSKATYIEVRSTKRVLQLSS